MSVPTRWSAPTSTATGRADARAAVRLTARARPSGTRGDSVKTITRSPGSSTSSPRGKIASPSRTMAPISAPRIGMSRKRLPTYSLSGRVVMSSTS